MLNPTAEIQAMYRDLSTILNKRYPAWYTAEDETQILVNSAKADYVLMLAKILMISDLPDIFDLALFVNAFKNESDDLKKIQIDIKENGLTPQNRMRLYSLGIKQLAEIIPDYGEQQTVESADDSVEVGNPFVNPVSILAVASGYDENSNPHFNYCSEIILEFTAQSLLDHRNQHMPGYRHVKLNGGNKDQSIEATNLVLKNIGGVLSGFAEALQPYGYGFSFSQPSSYEDQIVIR